ncbi:hypothetical protein [Herbaspirillum autotrophicum]|uniref:hypothetical protein n=1 Tax=Herbaspirillum autotrophicum TaxID=180195 RepID=UPI00067DDC8B|nr:hypothetical protein [Herbaspirillum autotrophicum]
MNTRFRFLPLLVTTLCLASLLLTPAANARTWNCIVLYDGPDSTPDFHIMVNASDIWRAQRRALAIAPRDSRALRRIPFCSSQTP